MKNGAFHLKCSSASVYKEQTTLLPQKCVKTKPTVLQHICSAWLSVCHSPSARCRGTCPHRWRNSQSNAHSAASPARRIRPCKTIQNRPDITADIYRAAHILLFNVVPKWLHTKSCCYDAMPKRLHTKCFHYNAVPEFFMSSHFIIMQSPNHFLLSHL